MRKKKYFIITILFILSLVLVGCGKKPVTTKHTDTEPTTTDEHIHEFGDWQEISKATCTEEGYRKRTCKKCGIVEYEIIPKKDHTYVNDKCSVCGHEIITDGFHIYYSSMDELYHIDDYTGESTTVRIPRYYDDGEHGEHNICIDRENIIDSFDCALKDCNIEKIIIGDGIKTIDDNMFMGLNSLKEVVFDYKVEKVGEKAFYNCPNLETITFNDDLQQIGFYAFAYCDIKEIRLPYYLGIIDVGAFSDNTNLTEVTYYNNITEIRDNAFNNTALESIKITYGLQYFGPQEKLPNLTEFNVDARNTKYIFENGCLINQDDNILVKAISVATIPDNIVYISSYALAYLDYSEVDFVVPSSVLEIGFCSFKGSTFKSLTLSEGLVMIDENAFTGVDITDSEDLEIILPSTVTYISYHAFQGFKCKKLTIPTSVTYLGYKAFDECEIEEIVIHSTTLDSHDCDAYWDTGIDLDITTITIIND